MSAGTSLRAVLFETIARRGDEDILVSLHEGQAISGTRLDMLTRAVAKLLLANDVAAGDRIAALLPNGTTFAILYLACLRAGIAIVPMAMDLPQAQIDQICGLAKPKLAVVDTGSAPRTLPCRHISIALDDCVDSGVGDFSPALKEDDVFSITFTSGSTGAPKGVVHRAERMLANAAAFNAYSSLDAQIRLLHIMPMYYMAGLLNTLLCPLLAGATVVLDQAFTPRGALTFWRTVIDHEINCFWLSPTMAHVILQIDRSADAPAYTRDRLKLPFMGTAALPPSLFDAFSAKYGVAPLQSYGLSELLLIATNLPRDARRDSVGSVLPGIDLRVLPTSELVVDTPYAFAGYLDPDTGAMPQGLDQSAFPTGDLVRVENGRQIVVTGRCKDLIIVGGVNISPQAIENVLFRHPSVRQVAVIGKADSVFGERPVAYLSLAENADASSLKADLQGLCRQYLKDAEAPADYVILDDLPVGPTGKVQKQLLRDRAPA